MIKKKQLKKLYKWIKEHKKEHKTKAWRSKHREWLETKNFIEISKKDKDDINKEIKNH